jgi:hypothetical protein
LTVKGVATAIISAVKGAESGQTISTAGHDFDFSKTFSIKDVKAGDIACGNILPTDCTVKIENRDKPSLVLEAGLMFIGHSVTHHDVKILDDAFSCAHTLDFSYTDAARVHATAQTNSVVDVEGNVALGNIGQYAAKVLWSSVPTVGAINVKPAEDKVTVEGVITTRIVYECEEKNLFSHVAQVPFSVNVKADGCTSGSNVSASVAPLSCNVKARRGKELLVDARMSVCVCANHAEHYQVVSNVTPGAAKAENNCAIVVHTAGANESLWSVAKSVNMPTAEIVRQCGADGEMKAGERLVLFRKQA